MNELFARIQRNRHYLSRFLWVWLPLTLLLALSLLLVYLFNANHRFYQLKTEASQAVKLGQKLSSSGLSNVRTDLLFLADQAETLLQRPATARNAALQDMFLNFAVRKGSYDQIRLLGVNGKEEIRINWSSGKAFAVKRELLQDKSLSYYRKNCMQLKQGEVYISRLDLNMEHDSIELPYKPALRYCTPVFSQHGHMQGLLVFNYLGQKLLDRILISASTTSRLAQTWLLNGQGYWLMGGNPGDAWAFMFPDKLQNRLESRDAEAWRLISNGAREGQFRSSGGLYTFARLSPFENTFANSTEVILDDEWFLVSHIPEASLAATNNRLAREFWWVFICLEIVLSAFAYLIAHLSLRKKFAEAAVKASEYRYRSLLDSAPDAIIIVNQEGKIELVNNQAENMFGYRRNELLARPVEMLIPEELRSAHHSHSQGYFRDPRVRAMGEGLELHARRKDGSRFPIEISLSPLDSTNGRVATAIIRDISTRIRAEQLHHESQERFRDLVHNLPIGIYRKTPGPRGKYLEANPALIDILEADSFEQLQVHSVSDFYAKPEMRQIISNKIMQNGAVNNEEVEFITLKGKKFLANITAVKKFDGQGNIYFDGIIEDISDRKRTQQQLQQLNNSLRERTKELEVSNRELEAFSYSVSHDLRAPLRAIDGFSNILLREYSDALDSKGLNFLERIRKAAQHMGQLIDDLLKLSRVSRAELSRECVNLSEMALSIMSELDKQEADHQIVTVIAPDINASCDRRLLHIVLTNLLNNAVKFSGKLCNAEIEVGATSKDGLTVYFVRDNGAGFDSAYADKLFGVFQRLHETSEFPGTGIGLATVQRIIHKHGGTIWADSKVNHGATFYFTLGEDGQA